MRELRRFTEAEMFDSRLMHIPGGQPILLNCWGNSFCWDPRWASGGKGKKPTPNVLHPQFPVKQKSRSVNQ